MNLGFNCPLITMVRSIFQVEPLNFWSDGNFAIKSPISFEFAICFANSKMGHTIYGFGVVFPKDQHGDIGFAIWAFPKNEVVHLCTQAPVALEFAHCVL